MKQDKRLFSAGLVLLMVIGLLAGCSRSGFPARALSAGGFSAGAWDPARAVGKVAPDFSGVDVTTGDFFTLREFEGKTVLLNFVNYGCNDYLNGVVSAQLVAVRQLYAERSDFVPVSVFCGCCPPEVLKEFARNNNLNWPWTLDVDGSIVATYSEFLGEFGYPTMVFMDKGQVITEVTGALDQIDTGAALDRASATPVGQNQNDAVAAATGATVW